MNTIVLGTFFGDEGKGQTVHNLCKHYDNLKRTIVIRFSGGHQVGHTVRHGKLEHTFSNFGSGTLLGVPTYWSSYCTVDPITTMKELEDLNKLGITPEIIYHPLCEVVIPFDVISQWNNDENLKHGTVGTGFKAALDRVAKGYHLTAMDCRNIMILRAKVTSIVYNYYADLVSDFPMLNIDEWCVKVHEFFNLVSISNEYILNRYKHHIFEGSQGILLDQRFGIMPYCTPSNTTCQNAMRIIKDFGLLGGIEHIYVTRPYITRHGNGPIPTTKPVREIQDPNNRFNEFQKSIRATEFDKDLFNHSLDIDLMFHFRDDYSKVIVTHKDEIPENFPLSKYVVSYYDKLEYS